MEIVANSDKITMSVIPILYSKQELTNSLNY